MSGGGELQGERDEAGHHSNPMLSRTIGLLCPLTARGALFTAHSSPTHCCAEKEG